MTGTSFKETREMLHLKSKQTYGQYLNLEIEVALTVVGQKIAAAAVVRLLVAACRWDVKTGCSGGEGGAVKNIL